MPALVPATGLFYGWVIVALCFLLLGLSAGTTQYLVGVFTVPFAEEFGASRGEVLFATSSLLAITGGIIAPFAGAQLRRFSIRRAVLWCVGWMGGGFAALAFTTALWQVALIYAAMLAVGVVTINLGANTLAATWFSAKRGRALGFVAAGTSAFGFLLPPLVSHGIAAFGWRSTCLLLAVMLWATLPLLARLLVDRPEQRGLLPDGATAVGAAQAAAPDASVWTVRSILASARFWQVVLPVGVCLATAVALLTSLIPLAIDAGIDARHAAYLASLTALCGVAGKVGFGFLADAIGQRQMVWIPLALVAAACGAVLGTPGYLELVAAALLLGFGIGAATPAWGALVGANFGRVDFSLAMGLMTPILSILLALSVPFAGVVYDRSGSYDGAWMSLIGALLAAAVVGAFLPGRNKAAAPHH